METGFHHFMIFLYFWVWGFEATLSRGGEAGRRDVLENQDFKLGRPMRQLMGKSSRQEPKSEEQVRGQIWSSELGGH